MIDENSDIREFIKFVKTGLEKKFSLNLSIEYSFSNDKNLIFDQLCLPYHLDKFKKILPNMFSIVVDRDPRDVYLDARTYNAYPITSNINTFINFYRTVVN